MENKSGFRECSRCGLRNKPTAKQCDFCGQKFDAVDEWELHVDALEKLSKESRRVEVTEDLSKKIESTIIRKGAPEQREEQEAETPIAKPEPVPIEEVVEKVEESPSTSEPEPVEPEPTTVVTFTATEAKPIETREDVPAVEEEPVVTIEEPTIREEPVRQVAPEPLIASQAEEVAAPVQKRKVRSNKKRRAGEGDRVFMWKFNRNDRKSVLFMTILIVGIILYVSSIAFSSTIGTVGSWSIIVLAGLMVVTGMAQTVIDWSPAHIEVSSLEEVIEICPECNERVSKEDERCPACGTEFEPSGHK